MKKNIKNYGLLLSDVKDEKAYRLGASSLPKQAINPSKDWTAYLPVYEPQFNSFFDSYGCTVWGTLNAKEILLKFLLQKEYNFSERFIYILANITPPGADPHTVIEVIRKMGVIDDALLPMTQNFFEFIKPNPMTDDLLERGLRFEYELKHEWVWERSDKLTKARKHELIRECLAYSPLGVSVTAWSERNGVYVDNGRPNTHWCVLVGENSKGWVIFDSYGQDLKTLSFDHNIEVCKRFLLAPSTREIERNILLKIIDKLLQLIGLYKATPAIIIAPVAPQPLVEPVPAPSKYDWDTPILARHSVRVICDEEGLTVEQKNTLCATVGAESGWKPRAVGKPNSNGSRDWGICQVNDNLWIGKGKDFPSTDYVLDNPEKCIRWMCKWWKKGKRTWWIAYKNGSYKNYL